ncbi:MULTISPECIES: hypothetical protein [unclassified Amycolatopsis]|nr:MULTISPECIES: hypothetical protein [unclassified Amycolatopsis]
MGNHRQHHRPHHGTASLRIATAGLRVFAVVVAVAACAWLALWLAFTL